MDNFSEGFSSASGYGARGLPAGERSWRRSGFHGPLSIASPIVLKDVRALECGCPSISRNARPIDIVAIKQSILSVIRIPALC